MAFISNIYAVFNLPSSWWRKLVFSGCRFFYLLWNRSFRKSRFLFVIMPPSFPLHEAVYISGFFEVLGGVGVLISRLRKIAGWDWLLF